MKKNIDPTTNRERNLIALPSSFVTTAMQLCHNSALAGHYGPERTLIRFRERYYLPGDRKIAFDHCKSCEACIMYKGSVAPSSTIFNYPIPSRPFEIVSFDTLGPFILSATHKYKYILVFSCHLTRYCEVVGVTDRTAENVAFAIRDRVIKSHGTPRTFMSDSAAEFCSAIVKQLCKDYDINRVNITVRYPAANGLVERTNGKILALLRTVVNAHQDNWDECLPEVQSAINSAYNVSVGDTPHFLLYGYDKILPYDLVVPSDSQEIGRNARICTRKYGEKKSYSRNCFITSSRLQRRTIILQEEKMQNAPTGNRT